MFLRNASPVIYQPDGEPIANPGFALTAGSVTVLPGRYEALVVAIKHAGTDECFLFNSRSYLFPGGANRDWALGRGRHHVECVIAFDGGRVVRGFTLPLHSDGTRDASGMLARSQAPRFADECQWTASFAQ